MSGSQKVIAGLAGYAGVGVGMLSGGITGLYFHDWIVCGTFKQGCGYREKNQIGNAGGFIGAKIGMTAGQALGTYAYGESVGLQGSYWSTLGWTAAYDATLFGASLLVKNDDSRATIQLVGLVGSLFVSVWAYESSLESTSSTSTVSQTPSKGLNFGVPTVSFDHHNGDRRFTLNLTGGQF